ncbi:LOW QUALITY PROTEIN: uncharacterized protein EMH_0015500 [Eimeria mitis]|uniref:CCHC-type domain-containing protein n=1 Tax=Eimeria mitis TaxID=44415 RepID=U6KAQ7_9EIME|nr:LOW QUALITY PROTEIN: uncharacterized protein EMH_0015500 [Eimeria mitis]CDJ33307.1 hypothetical protein EMH_0015500 [Eimeria mitis]
MQRFAADTTEGIVKLQRQTSDGILAATDGRNNATPDRIRQKDIIAAEDGTNMRSFLNLVEREFKNSVVPIEEWGELLGKYVTGKALVFVEFLQQSGVDMSDWQEVRKRLCDRFCSLTRKEMVKMLKKNTWTGNYSEYITRFTDIVAVGTHIPPEELVLRFFTLIPPEIGERISAEGTRKFRDWHEAAVALRAWAEPLETWRAARIKSLQEFMASDHEESGMEGSVLTNGETAPPVRKGGPVEEGNVRRCYECTGKGHFGRECPQKRATLDGATSAQGRDTLVGNAPSATACRGARAKYALNAEERITTRESASGHRGHQAGDRPDETQEQI